MGNNQYPRFDRLCISGGRNSIVSIKGNEFASTAIEARNKSTACASMLLRTMWVAFPRQNEMSRCPSTHETFPFAAKQQLEQNPKSYSINGHSQITCCISPLSQIKRED